MPCIAASQYSGTGLSRDYDTSIEMFARHDAHAIQFFEKRIPPLRIGSEHEAKDARPEMQSAVVQPRTEAQADVAQASCVGSVTGHTSVRRSDERAAMLREGDAFRTMLCGGPPVHRRAQASPSRRLIGNRLARHQPHWASTCPIRNIITTTAVANILWTMTTTARLCTSRPTASNALVKVSPATSLIHFSATTHTNARWLGSCEWFPSH